MFQKHIFLISTNNRFICVIPFFLTFLIQFIKFINSKSLTAFKFKFELSIRYGLSIILKF